MSKFAPKAWNPGLYLKFADVRLRPALDLLARVPLDDARVVVDLGCGAGSVVPHLGARFADAEITGVDSSAEMLARARADFGDAAHWVEADIASWAPRTAPDLIFSNAVLHWLDDHEHLFPRLMESLAPGGVLAVQMPNQFAAPSHVLMRQAALDGPWAGRLEPLLRAAPVALPGAYYDWFAPHSAQLAIWETTYIQTLKGDDPVVTWLASTALKPLLDALTDAAEREIFCASLAERLGEAYPRRADGTTLLPFKRLFIVAQKT